MTSAVQTLAQTAQQLFFVVGMGRSGTSLLQAMLSVHPNVAMAPETKFYTVIRRAGKRLGRLDSDSDMACAVDLAMDYWQIADMGLDRQTVQQLAASGERSWDTIFLAILTLHASKHGATRVGEKSPGHLHHISHLSHTFPEARFVHIIRDPRAVALSWKNVSFGSGRIAPRIQDWKHAVELHRRWLKELGPERYLLVRYEDLVCNAALNLQKICDFLSLEFSQSMLSPETRADRGFSDRQTDHMANTLKPIFTSSLDQWTTELSHRQIALIEQSLADEMEEMGYSVSGATTGFRRLQLTGGLASDFAWRLWRRLRLQFR